jgi:Amt family ammonium transporter
LKNTVGLRVNGDLEQIGLDLHEHDNQAYPEFVPGDEAVLSDELEMAEV